MTDLRLLSQKELAEALHLSERTLERWRSEQQGPPFISLVHGGSIRYRVSDVEDWLEGQLNRPSRSTVRLDGLERIHAAWRTRSR